MNSYHNTRLCVKAKAWHDKKPTIFIVKGQYARTLLTLAKAGPDGITALEVSGTWALRLSAYIHVLRHRYGLDIETLKEEHPGGWHARYVLHTPVEILETNLN